MEQQIAKITQSLTTAEDMRETTKMLMQPHANWEEYLTPAPLSIAIMGELVFISSDVNNDFSINKNPPPNGFQYIKYPDSFRACLMQICNSGWHAFNEAHKNMDQIRIHTATVPDYMKDAVKILFNAPDDVIEKLLPNQLANISDVANECVKLAEGVEKKYYDVINLIQELLEACINAEHFYGEELEEVKQKLKEAKLKEKTAKQLSDRSKKAMADIAEQVEEAQSTYKYAMSSIPSGWEMIGMNLVEGVANGFTGVIHGLATGVTGVMDGLANKANGKRGRNEQRHSAEDVDVASEMRILSSSGQILGIIAHLTEYVGKDEIDWKNLYDQKKKQVKLSAWANSQFQTLSENFQKMPNSIRRKKVLSLLNRGIAVCEEMCSFRPGTEWTRTQTQNLIRRFQGLNDAAMAFDCASKKTLGSPALIPKPPMMSKVGGTSGNKSAFQIEIENAYFRIEQSQEQLKQTREQYNKCVENMEKNEKELTDILCELQNCDVKKIDFDTTIKMLVKGMDAMGRVKEQWEKMVRFFQMVSNIIKTSLSKTLKNFVTTAEDTKKLPYNSKLFTKDLLYNQAFQASNIASLVHMISHTYTEVSSKYLMDGMSNLGRLMAMDKSNPEFLKERVKLKYSCQQAQKGILQLVLKNKEEFERNTDDRMAKIEGSLKAILPAAAPEKIERMKQIVQAGFGEEEEVEGIMPWFGEEEADFY